VNDTKLAEIGQIAATTGDDPELDTLILRLSIAREFATAVFLAADQRASAYPRSAGNRLHRRSILQASLSHPLLTV
jgi:hypothetical protein